MQQMSPKILQDKMGESPKALALLCRGDTGITNGKSTAYALQYRAKLLQMFPQRDRLDLR